MLYRKPLPCKNYLQERLDYNPDTGLLFWKLKQIKEGDRPSRVATQVSQELPGIALLINGESKSGINGLDVIPI